MMFEVPVVTKKPGKKCIDLWKYQIKIQSKQKNAQQMNDENADNDVMMIEFLWVFSRWHSIAMIKRFLYEQFIRFKMNFYEYLNMMEHNSIQLNEVKFFHFPFKNILLTFMTHDTSIEHLKFEPF